MLLQGLLGVGLLGEEHEGVPGGAAVGLADEQDAVLAVKDLAVGVAIVEELSLQNTYILESVKGKLEKP